jgi:hypothetical protein
MASSVVFNDGSSAALANQRPVPFDRLWNWTPLSNDIDDRAVTLGPGVTSSFLFRVDQGASFEIRDIPDTQMTIALRCKRHLERGGTCTVNTGDSAARVYTARLWPDARVVIEEQDAGKHTFRVRFELKNTAAADMIAEY